MPNAIKYKAGNLTGSLQKGNVALGVSGSFGPTSTTGWYNGPNPPTSGLYQIIETAASGDPEVFCPQNDAELIKFARWKGATGADTGSVAAVLAWIGTQTNLMAANIQYENIVTDGLVLNLDAGFVGSYPTTASTWYDISGNNNNGTLTNGPTFNSANSGSIVFDGIDDYSNMGNISYNRTTFSVFAWVNFPTYHSGWKSGITTKWYTGGGDGTGNEWFLGAANNSGPSGFSCTVQYGSGEPAYIFITDAANYVTNTWYHVGFTWNSGVLSLYKNGSLVNSTSTPNTSAQTTTQPIYVASFFNATNYPSNIKVSNTQLYNRALSSTEVTQNYNAQKGRFGL